MIRITITPFIAGIRYAFRTIDQACKRLATRINERLDESRRIKETEFPPPGFRFEQFTPRGEIQARPLFDGRYELWVYCGHGNNQGWSLQGTVHPRQVDEAVRNLQRPVIDFPAPDQPKDTP